MNVMRLDIMHYPFIYIGHFGRRFCYRDYVKDYVPYCWVEYLSKFLSAGQHSQLWNHPGSKLWFPNEKNFSKNYLQIRHGTEKKSPALSKAEKV